MGSTKPQRTRRRAVSQEDKERRRAAILGAAKKVFSAKGFHAATIADVARTAGIAYGSIYWYFDSKEALFQALMDDEEQALRSRIAGVLESGIADQDPEAMFRRAIGETLMFFEEDRAATKLLFRESLTFGGSISRHLYGIYQHFVGDLEQLMAYLQKRGLIRPGPPEALAFCAAALIGQLATRRLETDDGIDADTVADFVVSLLMDGMRRR
jgi:AcrR family transcriptional regulator